MKKTFFKADDAKAQATLDLWDTIKAERDLTPEEALEHRLSFYRLTLNERRRENPQEIHRTARHESAHAVMHVFLRLPNLDELSIATRVDIDESLNFYGRIRHRSVSPPGEDRILDRKTLLVIVAGPIGEGRKMAGSSAGSDMQQASAIAKSIAGRRYKELIERYQNIARRLLAGRLKQAVDTVTRLILDEETIDREIEEIIIGLLGYSYPYFWHGRGSLARSGRSDEAGSTDAQRCQPPD